MFLDAGLVAPVFEKIYAILRSLAGVWIPFTFIFLPTYLTRVLVKRKEV
jgi:hypothetical protein